MRLGNFVCYFILAGTCAILAGCARDRLILSDRGSLQSPQPPLILTTPAVYLLTNNSGSLANVHIEGPLGKSSGKLFASGSKLFYAPVEKKQPRKYGPAGGFSFLWDAAEGKGFVLSEALQGYAPISHSSGAATNIVIRSGPGSIALTATLPNGKRIDYQATTFAPGDLPLRISGGNPPFNVTFTKLRTEPPPPQVFQVPKGFTVYKSGEAMVDELAIRYRNLKRKIYD